MDGLILIILTKNGGVRKTGKYRFYCTRACGFVMEHVDLSRSVFL